MIGKIKYTISYEIDLDQKSETMTNVYQINATVAEFLQNKGFTVGTDDACNFHIDYVDDPGDHVGSIDTCDYKTNWPTVDADMTELSKSLKYVMFLLELEGQIEDFDFGSYKKYYYNGKSMKAYRIHEEFDTIDVTSRLKSRKH